MIKNLNGDEARVFEAGSNGIFHESTNSIITMYALREFNSTSIDKKSVIIYLDLIVIYLIKSLLLIFHLRLSIQLDIDNGYILKL